MALPLIGVMSTIGGIIASISSQSLGQIAAKVAFFFAIKALLLTMALIILPIVFYNIVGLIMTDVFDWMTVQANAAGLSASVMEFTDLTG